MAEFSRALLPHLLWPTPSELGVEELLALAGVVVLSLSLILVVYNRYRIQIRSAQTIERKNLALEHTLADLKESEARYRRLFDEASTAKLLIDPEQDRILDANEGLAELVGRTVDELVGESIPDLGNESLIRLLGRTDDTGLSQFSCLETLENAHGEPRDFEVWISFPQLASRVAVLITLHDVTVRRRLEEQRVRQEERERYIVELEARKAEVEARNAEMERFTYTVSHDLKNPLFTIKGFLGFIEKDIECGDLERIRNDLGRIRGAAENMSQLLEQLLQLSRVGRVMNEPQRIPLAELVEEALEMSAGRIFEHSVEVGVAADLPEVYGDRPRLVEVLQNLLDNAAKYIGDQPAPRVDLRAREVNGEVLVSIRDNGIGIDPRYHETVFGLFQQLDAGEEGTGVGLALVKRIIEVHGGRIWVESEGPGRGSTFTFALPAKPVAARPQAQPA